jgi:hypothetical protein
MNKNFPLEGMKFSSLEDTVREMFRHHDDMVDPKELENMVKFLYAESDLRDTKEIDLADFIENGTEDESISALQIAKLFDLDRKKPILERLLNDMHLTTPSPKPKAKPKPKPKPDHRSIVPVASGHDDKDPEQSTEVPLEPGPRSKALDASKHDEKDPEQSPEVPHESIVPVASSHDDKDPEQSTEVPLEPGSRSKAPVASKHDEKDPEQSTEVSLAVSSHDELR